MEKTNPDRIESLTNWLPGAGTGYVPFNPDNPNQYVPQIELRKSMQDL